jgi:inhibitor of cysteine peptidase
MIHVSSSDSGGLVHLGMQDTLEVSLESHPSTGYTWDVVSGQELLKLVSEPTFTATSQQVMGAGGNMRFEFRPVETGQTLLELVYHRPFEVGIEPAQKFTLSVIVEGMR